MDYGKYADRAYAKLAQYGGECSLIRRSEGVYDTGTNGYVTETSVISGKGIKSSHLSENADGTIIEKCDIRIMACFGGGAPEVNDTVEFGGVRYTLADFEELNPSGSESIYYILYCRE